MAFNKPNCRLIIIFWKPNSQYKKKKKDLVTGMDVYFVATHNSEP